MMNRYGLMMAVALAAMLAGGCATSDTQKAADDEDKLYVTGSRIPVKGSVQGPVSATSDRKAIDDMMRLPRPGTGGIVGAGGS